MGNYIHTAAGEKPSIDLIEKLSFPILGLCDGGPTLNPSGNGAGDQGDQQHQAERNGKAQGKAEAEGGLGDEIIVDKYTPKDSKLAQPVAIGDGSHNKDAKIITIRMLCSVTSSSNNNSHMAVG